MTLRDQLARFHGAITGAAPLDSARDLVERGPLPDTDELARLHVYEYAYTARIAGVLVHDYPKLAALAGEAALRAWTAPYLRAHPPASFTLREVGAHLPRWLAATEPARPEYADIARIERARTEVFDGPDAPPLSRDDLAAMDPVEFPSLRLQRVPASRIVTLTTTADDVWDALEAEQPAPEIAAATRTVLVWRRDLSVIHRTLEDDEARIVASMGTTFGAACELLDEATAAERAIELLVRWLDAGILVS